MLHQWQRKKSEFLLRDTSHGMIGYGHNQHDSYMISKTRCSTKSWRDARFNPTSHTFCRFADRKFNRNQSHIGALRDHCLPLVTKGSITSGMWDPLLDLTFSRPLQSFLRTKMALLLSKLRDPGKHRSLPEHAERGRPRWFVAAPTSRP